MASIKDIKGLSTHDIDKLSDAGVKTTDALLDKAAKKSERTALSKETGIADHKLLDAVNRADLYRIKGVGEEFSDLLEAAGVDSPGELSTRKAENLHSAMEALDSKKRLDRRVPSVHEIENFIAEAKKLDKVVTH